MSGDNFNRFAKLYDVFIHARDRLVWSEELRKNKQHFLVDLGGGTGRLVPHFLELAERVVLADHSFKMLQVSQYAYESRIDRVCCDLIHLPFKKDLNANFVLVDTIHHLYNPQPILEKISGWICNQNRLLIEEPDIHYFSIKVIAVMERVLGMKSSFYTKEEISAWFPGTQFKIDAQQDGANFYLIVQQK